MFKNIAIAALAVALPLGFASAPASAAISYAEQVAGTVARVTPNGVSAAIGEMSSIRVARLQRSCNGSGLSAQVQHFCSLVDRELDEQDDQDEQG